MKKHIYLILIALSLNASAQTLKDCATCSAQIIKTGQIKDLSIDEIRFLTNDLFARKGYVFQDADIDAYYSNKSWYKPVNANFTIEYSNIEKQNIKLFQDRTKELKTKREQLINELKTLKNLLDANNKQELKKQFSFDYELGDNTAYLKNVTDEIYMDDIHWFKKEGLYKVIKDNGDIIERYILRIDGDNVSFEFAIKTVSEIGNGDTLYPKEHIMEYVYLYNFKFINGKLIFDKLVVIE